MLQIQNLVVRFGDYTALDNVTWEVKSGHGFIGLIGPNGAGKTTLASVLLGLRKPTVGKVELGGMKIGYCCDTPEFEGLLTASEVMMQTAALKKTEGYGYKHASRDLERVGLAGKFNTRTAGFSRGMKQRLGIAASLVGNPDMLLLDEPTSALDPLGRHEILEMVKEISQERLVVVSTHLLEDVQFYANEVLMLDAGRRLYSGRLDALFSKKKKAIELYLKNEEDKAEAVSFLSSFGYASKTLTKEKERSILVVEDVKSLNSFMSIIGREEFPEIGAVNTKKESLYDIFEALHWGGRVGQ